MKGTIPRCLQDYVSSHHGEGVWRTVCVEADVDPDTRFAPQSRFDDAMVYRLISATTSVLGVTLEEAARAFGRHWAHVYAARLYPVAYEENRDLVSFIFSVNDLHRRVIEDTAASPPFLDLSWESPTRLLIGYRSDRHLIAVAKGLLEGYAAHFEEDVDVNILSASRLELVFPHPSPAFVRPWNSQR